MCWMLRSIAISALVQCLIALRHAASISSVALSPLRSLHSRSFSMPVDHWLLSLRLWTRALTLRAYLEAE